MTKYNTKQPNNKNYPESVASYDTWSINAYYSTNPEKNMDFSQ